MTGRPVIILINAANSKAGGPFSAFSPVFPPVGLAMLAAVSEREGYTVHLIDQQITPDVMAAIPLHLLKNETAVFGISMLTQAFTEARKLAEKIRSAFPEARIVFGGMHPTALPEEILQNTEADLVIRGEAEHTWIAWLDAVSTGKDWKNMAGISFRSGNQLVHRPDAPLIESLDTLPRFPYHYFRADKRYDLGIIVSSRGCRQQCSFCSNRIINRHTVRSFSTARVIAEIRLLEEQYGKTHILFLDDDFMGDSVRLHELSRGIQEAGLHLKLRFSFQARCDKVNPEIMDMLYQCGFRTVFFGIESAADHVLAGARKGAKLEDYSRAIRISKDCGMDVQASFIYGLPGETRQDRLLSLRFALSQPISVAKFNNVVPYPGTNLYKQILSRSELQFTPGYGNANTLIPLTDGPFRRTPFPLLPEGTAQGELRRFIILSYMAFYLRKGRLKMMNSGKSDSIRWLYIRGSDGQLSPVKIFLLIHLLAVTAWKCLFLLLLPVKENYFIFLLRQKKQGQHA